MKPKPKKAKRNNPGNTTAKNSNVKGIFKAAALKYEPDRDYAPRVTAVGRGELAGNIVEAARGADVPVYRDEALAATLNELKIGSLIPVEIYEVVAEVLAYVIRIDQQQAGNHKPGLTSASIPHRGADA